MTSTTKEAGVSPYDSLLMDAVAAAKHLKASDIHIEPTRLGVVIRMRVFGDMQPPWREITVEHRLAFIKAVKQATGLEIGVSGRPQDGRLDLPALGLDLRVNLLPTLFGEKIVLRLLEQTRRLGLAEIKLTAQAQAVMERALRGHDGVLLISGPTGSGKTSTLYSMLQELGPASRNIVTLEDPVEYTIDGVNQVRIGGKLTFAAALRAVLRQDPDVILVGEIRDRETAELAFQAASTGHLVLSTIHANSAAEVVTRLIGLGVEAQMIQANLRLSAAQRLVKALCQRCAVPADSDMVLAVKGDLRGRGLTWPAAAAFKVRGPGCDACRGGINGRLPLLEYLNEDEINGQQHPTNLIPARTIAQVAIERAACGQIDLREVNYFV